MSTERPPWATDENLRLPDGLETDRAWFSVETPSRVNEAPFLGMRVRLVGATTRRNRRRRWWPFEWPFGRSTWTTTLFFQAGQ